jgi:hypothetical protein
MRWDCNYGGGGKEFVQNSYGRTRNVPTWMRKKEIGGYH